MVSRLSILLVLGIAGTAAPAAAATTNFDVAANGMASFSINGAANPTLTLTRGQTYVFNVTVFGHPFWITTARGAGDAEANQYSDGVTGNGASPGIPLTFVVPATGPATLFYQCSFHDPMGGTLLIVPASPPPPPPVPAINTRLLVALGALLIASAVIALRRRVR